MRHLLKIKCAHSPLNLRILCSKRAPYTPTTAQVPNIALPHTERITMWRFIDLYRVRASKVFIASLFIFSQFIFLKTFFNINIISMTQSHIFEIVFCLLSSFAMRCSALALLLSILQYMYSWQGQLGAVFSTVPANLGCKEKTSNYFPFCCKFSEIRHELTYLAF